MRGGGFDTRRGFLDIICPSYRERVLDSSGGGVFGTRGGGGGTWGAGFDQGQV